MSKPSRSKPAGVVALRAVAAAVALSVAWVVAPTRVNAAPKKSTAKAATKATTKPGGKAAAGKAHAKAKPGAKASAKSKATAGAKVKPAAHAATKASAKAAPHAAAKSPKVTGNGAARTHTPPPVKVTVRPKAPAPAATAHTAPKPPVLAPATDPAADPAPPTEVAEQPKAPASRLEARLEAAQVDARREYEGKILSASRRIAELKASQESIVATSRTKSPALLKGIELLGEYDALLKARYVDDEGAYQKRLEISARDRENVNKLLKAYLKSSPLYGRISAREARQALGWGMERLREQASALEEPSESNSSEVEIVAHKIRVEEARIEEAVELASKQGIEIDLDQLAKNYAGERVPAGE